MKTNGEVDVRLVAGAVDLVEDQAEGVERSRRRRSLPIEQGVPLSDVLLSQARMMANAVSPPPNGSYSEAPHGQSALKTGAAAVRTMRLRRS